jgi:ribosomal protein S18 acetylase RimI-like enzyme
MKFSIREANAKDLDALNELNREVQTIHHKIDRLYFKKAKDADIRGELHAMIDDKKCGILIAVMSDLILGFLSYRESALPESGLTNNIPMIFIHHMGVKRIYRKQSIGTALMDAVFKIANLKNIKRVQLDVWTLNLDAKNFFQKRGFRTINEIMLYNS